MNDSVAIRLPTSSFEAHSKNSSTASRRLDLASSTVAPCEATSNSGHSATNPSSSRVNKAVSVRVMIQIVHRVAPFARRKNYRRRPPLRFSTHPRFPINAPRHHERRQPPLAVTILLSTPFPPGNYFAETPSVNLIVFERKAARFHIMNSTVTQRLSALEKKVAALSRKSAQPKDWRRAVGTLRDTKLAREADELGRQYRTKQVKP